MEQKVNDATESVIKGNRDEKYRGMIEREDSDGEWRDEVDRSPIYFISSFIVIIVNERK